MIRLAIFNVFQGVTAMYYTAHLFLFSPQKSPIKQGGSLPSVRIQLRLNLNEVIMIIIGGHIYTPHMKHGSCSVTFNVSVYFI